MDGQTSSEWDERAFIDHFEAASTDELARILSLPTRREEDALVAYLGADRYARMHERALRRNLRRATEEPKANVVVLHGIMGAELTATDRTGANTAVWVRPLRLLAGAIRRLQLDTGGLQEADLDWTVRPSAILKKHYGELILSLSKDYRVLPFFYDWRKDIKHAGDALNAAITSSFSADKPVHLVAHSMGGLVARSFIADYPDRWNAMRGRLVMLGTPNLGSYDIVRVLAGRERLIRLLALADFRMSLDGAAADPQQLPRNLPTAPVTCRRSGRGAALRARHVRRRERLRGTPGEREGEPRAARCRDAGPAARALRRRRRAGDLRRRRPRPPHRR